MSCRRSYSLKRHGGSPTAGRRAAHPKPQAGCRAAHPQAAGGTPGGTPNGETPSLHFAVFEFGCQHGEDQEKADGRQAQPAEQQRRHMQIRHEGQYAEKDERRNRS